MFDFSNCSTKSKYYDSSNKLVVGKMKGKIVGVAIERFVRLKPKMKSYLEDDNKLTISHNVYKDDLWNHKCLRHSMNRIPSKNHRIGTYEINKISFSCFDDKI